MYILFLHFFFYIPRTRWPDRSDLSSDHLWTHACSRCARNTWSGADFERTFVWTMVWILSNQRSRRSVTVWPEAVLSANLSDQRPIRAHTSLIRGRFVRTLVWSEDDSSEIFFSIFFCFCFANWGCLSQESTIQTHFDQRPIESLMGWSETRGLADSNCPSHFEKLGINCRSRNYYLKLSKFIY